MEVTTVTSVSHHFKCKTKYATSWTPHFPILHCTPYRLGSTFWLDSTLKLYCDSLLVWGITETDIKNSSTSGDTLTYDLSNCEKMEIVHIWSPHLVNANRMR